MKKYFSSKIFILVLIVSVLVSINISAQNKKVKEIQLNTKKSPPVIINYQPANIQTVLYDQTSGTVTGTGPASQDFETANDIYDCQAADNFTVTGGPWTINQVVIGGAYFNGAGPAASFNVYIYNDNSGVPGSLVTSALLQPYSFAAGFFSISISPSIVLNNGNYWISVQCRMDFSAGGQFAWTVVSGAYGSVAQWQNPGGGFGACPTWGPITTCNTTTQTDLSFSLNNLAGPGYATNPVPANGATLVSAPNTTLSWTNPASGVTSVSVYFGTSPGSLSLISSGTIITSIGRTGLSYFTPYYWRVDEIGASGTTTGIVWSFTTMCNATTAPWTQDFESGVFVPDCWGAGGNLWGNSNLIGTNISGYGTGSYSAFADFYDVSAGTDNLISIGFDASSLTVPVLRFDWAYATFSGEADEMDIYYSTNSGGSWTLLLAMPGGTNGILNPYHLVYTNPYGGTLQPVLAGDWSTMTLSLPSGVNMVRFTAISAYGNSLFLDNIKVFQSLANDVGTFSVDLNSNNSAGTIVPKATVKNFGSATNTFNVQMIIGSYSSTKTVTSLVPGATQQVTFDNWSATAGNYIANVCTQLGTDGDPSNNCLSKSVGVYTGTWSNGITYNLPRAYAGSATYSQTTLDVTTNYMYVVGGIDSTVANTETQCDVYNVNTNTWTSISPLPAGRDRLTAVTVGNYVYAIGGYAVAASDPAADVYKYDIAGNSWSSVASLPAALGWGQAIEYNGKIYLAGGIITGSVVTAAVYVYDPVANTWTAATSMPAARFGGAFAITGNKLVYVAGIDDAFALSDDVFVGTITGTTTITWTTVDNKFPGMDNQSIPQSGRYLAELTPKYNENQSSYTENAIYPPGGMYRFDGATWGSDGIIVATGTSNGFIPANPSPCYIYKPGTDSWTKSWDVPTPVIGTALGSVSDGSTWKLVIAWGDASEGSLVSTHKTQIWSDNIGASTTFSLSLNVSNGWNLLSVPGNNPAGMGVSNWWSNVTGTVYKFVPGSGYAGITTTTPGEGYWMKNTGPSTYNYPALQVVPHNPLNATAGWNMIGGFEDVVPVGSLIVSAGTIQFPIYQFNPGAGYASATNLNPGMGYWIKVTQNCTITMPDLLEKGSNNELADEYIKQDWGKIIITDAEGNSYTLYSVTGEVNLDNYELPPLPPAGIFDVRYGSGRVAEDVSSLTQTIEMSGAEYPITVKVVGMNVKLTDESGKVLNAILNSGESLVVGDSRIEKLMVSGETIPIVYSLEQNYPNPFNPSTVIEFSLPEDVSNVKLSVYNALGEKVAELVNSSLTAGRYSYQWNAKNVATGMYIYELRTDKFVSVKKMLLLK